ncbi:MAG: hypothetical protein HRU18_26290 [Pseudoalteromonas sp.]|uniref:hypothetical protein n=1 Tax=Pseudoalteromonas sp. TaxID=53249 RepID=UPI001D24A613|nr:hypothetical protein [Pseudoalteromonas sp.]NRA81725.1 hypothetical protein [Pseudoalteromonas sp.]
MSRHVIDTNVLIVASGEHPESPFRSENHPVEDPAEAEKVLDWLIEFQESNRRMVVDCDYAIQREYSNKLTEQDYGQRVLFEKMSKNEIDYVSVDWVDDTAAVDKAAVLEEPLRSVVHDLADTKIVAACIKANEEKLDCTIVNACDTDWYDWETELKDAGVNVEQIIDIWLREKWRQHHDR